MKFYKVSGTIPKNLWYTRYFLGQVWEPAGAWVGAAHQGRQKNVQNKGRGAQCGSPRQV